MPLHVIPDLNATNDPEAFMVYEQSARGGT